MEHIRQQHDPPQSILHLLIRRGRTARNTDAQQLLRLFPLLVRLPEHFVFQKWRAVHDVTVDQPVLDGVLARDALGRVYVVRPDAPHLRDLEQVRGVRRVESSYNQDEVQVRLGRVVVHVAKFVDGVLSDLRGVAYGVELVVVVVDQIRSVLAHHRLLQKLADGPRLFLVHGCLVGQTNFLQVLVRIKVRAARLAELLHESLLGILVTFIRRQNKISDIFGLILVLYAYVCFAHGLGCHRFLVRVLTVDDRCQSTNLVGVNSRPDLGNPWARGVNNLHALRVQFLHLVQRGTKRREHYDIPFLDFREVLRSVLLVLLNEVYVLIVQPLVDHGVVDQFVRYVNVLVRERLHGAVRQVDGTLHAPAKTVIFRKVEHHAVLLELVVRVVLHLIHERGIELIPHVLLDVGLHIAEDSSATIEALPFRDLLALVFDVVRLLPLLFLLRLFYRRVQLCGSSSRWYRVEGIDLGLRRRHEGDDGQCRREHPDPNCS
mmetsp:Transcript_38481/g.92140  ORF Transcript_38481/g.92140 Transcript_38481/m.92140 type:complete len:489 (+) Transcript_38481:151-1617(+)